MSQKIFFLSTRQRCYLPLKRFFDLFFSLISILFLSFFMLIISFFVLVDTGSFPIFRQKRVGKNNKEFLILKFRSMKKGTPDNVPSHLLENSNQYISKFGRFLRRFSIDEIPQLFNIFIGQMSFIGPRPALWNQFDLIELREKNKSCYIKPGLSGLAQCNGRDLLSVEEKATLDGIYFNNFSFCLDTKLFFKTIINVFSKKDVIEGKQS